MYEDNGVPDRENTKTTKRKRKKHKQKRREKQKVHHHGSNASKRRKMHRRVNKRREQRSQTGSKDKDDDSEGDEGANLDPKITRTKTKAATSPMDTEDDAAKDISERGAAVMQRIRAARAKRLQQQAMKKKRLANASKEKQIKGRQTSKRNEVVGENAEENAKLISHKKSREQNECKSASAINDDGERKPQSAEKVATNSCASNSESECIHIIALKITISVYCSVGASILVHNRVFPLSLHTEMQHMYPLPRPIVAYPNPTTKVKPQKMSEKFPRGVGM